MRYIIKKSNKIIRFTLKVHHLMVLFVILSAYYFSAFVISFYLLIKYKLNPFKSKKIILHKWEHIGDFIFLLSAIKNFEEAQLPEDGKIVVISTSSSRVIKIVRKLANICECKNVLFLKLPKMKFLTFFNWILSLKEQYSIYSKLITKGKFVSVPIFMRKISYFNKEQITVRKLYCLAFHLPIKKTKRTLFKARPYQIKKAEEIFKKYKLSYKRTIIIAPETGTLKNQIPSFEEKTILFYEMLIRKLKRKGYKIVLNSDIKMEGAISLKVSLDYFIPFLNLSGYLLGTRSGLFDLAVFSKAKLFVYYPNKKYFVLNSLSENWDVTNNLVEVVGSPDKILTFLKYFR